MSYKSLAEKFYEQYEQPVVGAMTVGFSGIDPQKKRTGGIETTEPLPEAIKEEINEAVKQSFDSQAIVIDCGEIE